MWYPKLDFFMADFSQAKSTFVVGVEAAQVFVAGEEAAMIFGRGTQVFPNTPFRLYSTTAVDMVADANGFWFEFGFRVDAVLTGNAGAGWTDVGNYVKFEIEQSLDLAAWSLGKFGASPDGVIDHGDGSFTYWSRCYVPVYLQAVMVDLVATSDRYGKSITAIEVMGTAVDLPNFPYAMPAEAASLQADLRAEGYTGATVTSTAGSLVAVARNHTPTGTISMVLTQNGSAAVTGVTAYVPGTGNVTVSLAGYPYAMPSQRAALQADLRTAGYGGTVIMLYGDAWVITLPDRTASGTERSFLVTLDPGDPFPFWDSFGVYQGENPATGVTGTSGNVRTPAGAPLEEAGRQFARLKLSRGTRYDGFA